MKRLILILIGITSCFKMAISQSIYPGQHADKIRLPLQAPVKAYSFDLKDIRLLDSPFKQNMERESKWIMFIQTDQLLHSFRTSAGVYAGDDKGVYVNLFIPSELTWNEKGIKMKMETAFPKDENVKLSLSTGKPVKISVYLRYPAWTSNVEVKVNGKKITVKQIPSGYITINRTWKEGDQIEVRYPMNLYLAETNDNPDKAAVMYGPLVLAGVMGTDGMNAPAPFSNPELYNDYYTCEYNVPKSIKTNLQLNREHLSKDIIPIKGEKPTFRTIKENIRLEPIYRIHHQRYVVYWDLIN